MGSNTGPSAAASFRALPARAQTSCAARRARGPALVPRVPGPRQTDPPGAGARSDTAFRTHSLRPPRPARVGHPSIRFAASPGPPAAPAAARGSRPTADRPGAPSRDGRRTMPWAPANLQRRRAGSRCRPAPDFRVAEMRGPRRVRRPLPAQRVPSARQRPAQASHRKPRWACAWFRCPCWSREPSACPCRVASRFPRPLRRWPRRSVRGHRPRG